VSVNTGTGGFGYWRERALAAEVERDEVRRQVEGFSRFGQEQHAYIVELETALRKIAEQQQKTLFTIQSNGFVFDSIGAEPGNWQHLAFTIYTDLCEIDSIARAALTEGSHE
jgi:hypothetical protein